MISEPEFASMMREVDLLLKGIIMKNERTKLACCFCLPVIGCVIISCCLDGSRPCCPTSKMNAQCVEAHGKIQRWNTPQLEWGVDFQPMSSMIPGTDSRMGMAMVYMKTPGAEVPGPMAQFAGQAQNMLGGMMGGGMQGMMQAQGMQGMQGQGGMGMQQMQQMQQMMQAQGGMQRSQGF